jgi:hypothetical protein
MDNPETGDVSFEARGRTFTLRYTTAAFCALEEHLDRGMFDILEELGSWAPKFDAKGKPLPETAEETSARVRRMRLGFCRAVFWAGFHDRHPEITIEQAGELMSEVGGMIGAMNLISKGMEAAQPKKGENAPARPPRRANGRHAIGSPS